MNLRRANAIITISLLFLILVHIMMGVFQMTGITLVLPLWKKVLSYTMVALVLAHGVIGAILTHSSLKLAKKQENKYVKQNCKFWIMRISGFLMVIFIAYHIWLFSNGTSELLRLKFFGEIQLAVSLLLVLAIFVHIGIGIRSLFISIGLERLRKFIKDSKWIFFIVLSIGAVAFVIYYLRWNVLWQ